jgi:hypothetical protein
MGKKDSKRHLLKGRGLSIPWTVSPEKVQKKPQDKMKEVQIVPF